jgi:hypothetical protein
MALLIRSGLETFPFCAWACSPMCEREAIMLSLVCALRDSLALLIEEESLRDILAAL